MKKRLTFILCFVLVFSLLAVEASAYIPLDINRKGSVTINTTYQGKPVSGGSLTIYRVASVQLNQANPSFVLTSEFEGSGASMNELYSAQTAQILADHAKNAGLAGVEKSIKNATVSFEDLELGVYLFVQHRAASGYSKMTPFLVTVPMVENDEYVYDVDGSPKLQLKPQGGGGGGGDDSGDSEEPVDPPKDPEEPKDKDPEGEKLPDTGLNNWPIPVLAVSGTFLVALGWYLRATSRKKRKRCR